MNSFLIDFQLSEHIGKTKEGYLIVAGVPIARTGKQEYRLSELGLGGDEIVEVDRPASEVFSPDTIISFEGKPIVSPHPPMFINAENISGYQKGHIQNVRKGDHALPNGEWPLLADLIITDSVLISRVEAKAIRELSAGYDYKLQIVEDEHDPIPKFFMWRIRGNHLAVVPIGRAGDDVRIMDSKEGVMEPEVKVTAEEPKLTVSQFHSLVNSFRSLFARDADPGATERNEEKAARSLEKKERTVDESLKRDLKKEEGGLKENEDQTLEEVEHKAGPPKPKLQGSDKKGKDADEEKKEEEEKKATDARIGRLESSMTQMANSLTQLTNVLRGQDAGKCTCDAEEGEAHDVECPMFKKEGEDSALDPVPVLTLKKDEIPENPIPGADSALAVATRVLRSFRPHVIQTAKDSAIRQTYNDLAAKLKELQGSGRTKDGYNKFLETTNSPRVRERSTSPSLQVGDANTSENAGRQFEEAAKKFLGKPINSATAAGGE